MHSLLCAASAHRWTSPPALPTRPCCCTNPAAAPRQLLVTTLYQINSIAKGFADQLVPFTAQDYIRTLAYLYRHLAGAAAQARDWDGAIYWLQQLINHDVSRRGLQQCSRRQQMSVCSGKRNYMHCQLRQRLRSRVLAATAGAASTSRLHHAASPC